MGANKDLNIFQIILIVVFLLMGIIGIGLFATGKAGNSSSKYNAVVWGILPKANIDKALDSFRTRGQDPNFTYEEFERENFEQVLLKAIAEGTGPDAIIFSDDMYYNQYNRLLTIPNDTVTADSFVNTYLDISKMFRVADGVKAFPLLIDPLVMYYNIDILKSDGIITAPKDWAEFANLSDQVVERQDTGVVDKAYTALGEFDNINHAKEIIFSMLSQVGVDLGFYDQNVLSYVSGLNKAKTNDNGESAGKLSRDVLIYYTEFANPSKPVYTWNKSFSSSRDAFLSGDLAIYFGRASEIEYIRTRNPNLNFAIAEIPQADQNKKVTHGRVYSLGFLITSKNPNATYQNVMNFFDNYEFNSNLSASTRLASARKDVLLSDKNTKSSVDMAVINNTAIYAKTWLDPNPSITKDYFSKMINAIVSGSQNISDAISDFSDRLDKLYTSY